MTALQDVSALLISSGVCQNAVGDNWDRQGAGREAHESMSSCPSFTTRCPHPSFFCHSSCPPSLLHLLIHQVLLQGEHVQIRLGQEVSPCYLTASLTPLYL